jgi:curved DNA-binding protein CbpA
MPRAPFDPATDYYRLLGVPPTAAPDEIQAAYRRLAKAYHPDLNAGSPSAAARMARVNVAKSVLLDPHVRSAYDQVRRARFGPVAAAAAVARPRPASTSPVAAAAARRAAAGYPGARAGYPAARTVAWSAVPRRSGPRLDRHSAILLAIVAPLLGALLMYVADAVEVAGRPTPAPPPDLAFTQRPHARTEGTAQTAFFMVAGQPPNRSLAISANNEIRSALDSTPEGEMLRAVGRRLVQAGTTGDQQAWDSAVLDLCLLAKHCP